jgi:hypothetical protein
MLEKIFLKVVRMMDFDIERLLNMSENERIEFLREWDQQNVVYIASHDYNPLIDSALEAGNKELFNALVEQKKEVQAREEEARRLLNGEE